jgi:hypothetical protein
MYNIKLDYNVSRPLTQNDLSLERICEIGKIYIHL